MQFLALGCLSFHLTKIEKRRTTRDPACTAGRDYAYGLVSPSREK